MADGVCCSKLILPPSPQDSQTPWNKMKSHLPWPGCAPLPGASVVLTTPPTLAQAALRGTAALWCPGFIMATAQPEDQNVSVPEGIPTVCFGLELQPSIELIYMEDLIPPAGTHLGTTKLRLHWNPHRDIPPGSVVTKGSAETCGHHTQGGFAPSD